MKRAAPFKVSSITGAVCGLIATLAFFGAGIVFLIVGIAPVAAVLFLLSAGMAGIAVYCFRTAAREKRASGADAAEEPAPTEEWLPMKHYRLRKGYCPYCGRKIEAGRGEGFVYCMNCGRKL